MSRRYAGDVGDDPDPVADTRWLDDDELNTWVPFSGMLLSLLSALEAQLQRDANLSLFGYLVLAGLSEAPERTLPMSELALLANGSQSRLSHAVSTLERRGWVRRSPCPENGRITMATLTDDGYDKVVASVSGHVEIVRRLVLDPLHQEQLRSLGDVSRAILTAVAGPCAAPLHYRRGRGQLVLPEKE
jgi:DNA-binding MarR family transcriptional regulator